MASPSIRLVCGDYREALKDVERVDCLITDPPYSDRTHAGHDSGTRSDGCHDASRGHRKQTRAINYAAWSADDMREFVEFWSPRVGGWFVVLTDDESISVWRDAMDAAGRVRFAAVPVVEIGSRVRLTGDGPSSWSCYAVVSRPRSRAFARWGTLPGAYVYTGHGDRVMMGGKRMECMRDLVRDYSRPGDLVCDPCAGGATTLIAAQLEHRNAIGSEMDPETHAKALARIEGGSMALRSPQQERMW